MKKRKDYILIEYRDYSDYNEHEGYYSPNRSGQYYLLAPTAEIYNKLKVGDYIGVETEPDGSTVWYSTIEKKYKNGNILVYEA